MSLKRPRGAIIDLDGTIYVGKALASGAADGLAYLRSHQIPHVFLTNNGSRTREEMSAFLSQLGTPIGAEDIVTSSTLLALGLRRVSDDPVVCIGGATGLPGALREAGLRIVGLGQNDARSVSLAVGWMDSLDFSLMAKLLSVQKQIQRIFVTDRDRAYPGQYGERLPGTAWVIAAIEELLEMEAVLGGKPNPEAFALAAEIMGMPVKDVVVIGDSVDTDIMPARASGAQAILLDGPLCRARGSAALQKEGLEVCEDLADAVSVVFD